MLLLAPNVDVVGIGVVAGDAWLDQAMYHTLKIVELCGKPEVPVAAGSEEPLLNSQEMMRAARRCGARRRATAGTGPGAATSRPRT
jgi:inosine-uridine nucleoside N-ribohydrolase